MKPYQEVEYIINVYQFLILGYIKIATPSRLPCNPLDSGCLNSSVITACSLRFIGQ
jgi:hypothetical protein